MKKVGVLFGGKSVEHEVSVITGMQVMENMDRTRYEPVPVYITKEGKWLTGDGLKDFAAFKNRDIHGVEVFLRPGHGGKLFGEVSGSSGLFGKKSSSLQVVEEVDLFFPALHGTGGEDGVVQGVLESAQVPYAGCDVISAAIGMDKVMMRRVFEEQGLPVMKGIWFFKKEWQENPEKCRKSVETLGYPVFVKPSNLGSSIGISKVHSPEELDGAVELAASYARKILVEQAAEEPRELNMAVFGTDGDYQVSPAEEPMGWKDLLSFEDKYMRGNKSKSGAKGDHKRIPADLTEDERSRMETLAKEAMNAIQGTGTARIDFLYGKDGRMVINEINTLPGSIAFYLWEAAGWSMKDLITGLLEQGERRFAEQKDFVTAYDVDLFSKTGYGSKL